MVPVESYPAKTFGEKELADDDMLKLMEMNDNHVEYHTVKEFLTFCGRPRGRGRGERKSTFPGKYLEGGKAAASSSTSACCRASTRARCASSWWATRARWRSTRLLEGLSAVGGNSSYTFYKPTDDKYRQMIQNLSDDIPTLLPCMGLKGELLAVGRPTTSPRTPRAGASSTRL